MKISLNDLKESNEFLNILLDNINSAIFIVDKQNRVRNINNSFKTIFQKQENQVIDSLCGGAIGCEFENESGVPCGETIHCPKCTLRNSSLRAFTEKVPTSNELLKRSFYINGKKVSKYFLFSSKYVNYHGEEMVLTIIDDITDLEKKKLSLEKSNNKLEELMKIKNDFMGIAAHDLRNPIGGIKALSEMLMENDFSHQEIKESMKMIYDSSSFSLNLLNDLLDISKIESGKLEIRYEKVNYKEFLDEVITFNSLISKKKDITFLLDYCGAENIIFIDKEKIRQVISNFLSNAFKYSPPETTTKIKVSSEDGQILTEVIDEGPGIPKDELNSIFNPFQTTSVKSSNHEKSTGLGLTITKKIIESHKGKIGVKSILGKGSNFYFSLPLKIGEDQ